MLIQHFPAVYTFLKADAIGLQTLHILWVIEMAADLPKTQFPDTKFFSQLFSRIKDSHLYLNIVIGLLKSIEPIILYCLTIGSLT